MSTRDLGVTETLRRLLPDWTIPLFEFAALFGDLAVIVGGIGLVLCLDLYRSARNGSNEPLSEQTGFILAVVLGGLALTLLLKTAIGAQRPPETLQAVTRDGNGFPSGHTMSATIFWGALTLWGRWRTRRQRLLASAGIVTMVGVSRLALGVHYVGDVVASVLLGVGYLLVMSVVFFPKPLSAFAVAVGVGTGAVVLTGGSGDGVIAFVGCIAGGAGWWICDRPRVQRVWTAVVRRTVNP